MAVVTGILRVARASLFSGQNNLGVYTLLDTHYNTCFGFSGFSCLISVKCVPCGTLTG